MPPALFGRYVAEMKLDGERLMLHFKRGGRADGTDRAEWYTRNRKNFTGWYGEAMASVLQRCLTPEVRDCLLDGEMMVWNRLTGDYASFGENRALGDYQRRVEQGYQPCYVVFDIVWLNGENLAPLPLRERRARLEGALQVHVHGTLAHAPPTRAHPRASSHVCGCAHWRCSGGRTRSSSRRRRSSSPIRPARRRAPTTRRRV